MYNLNYQIYKQGIILKYKGLLLKMTYRGRRYANHRPRRIGKKNRTPSLFKPKSDYGESSGEYSSKFNVSTVKHNEFTADDIIHASPVTNNDVNINLVDSLISKHLHKKSGCKNIHDLKRWNQEHKELQDLKAALSTSISSSNSVQNETTREQNNTENINQEDKSTVGKSAGLHSANQSGGFGVGNDADQLATTVDMSNQHSEGTKLNCKTGGECEAGPGTLSRQAEADGSGAGDYTTDNARYNHHENIRTDPNSAISKCSIDPNAFTTHLVFKPVINVSSYSKEQEVDAETEIETQVEGDGDTKLLEQGQATDAANNVLKPNNKTNIGKNEQEVQNKQIVREAKRRRESYLKPQSDEHDFLWNNAVSINNKSSSPNTDELKAPSLEQIRESLKDDTHSQHSISYRIEHWMDEQKEPTRQPDEQDYPWDNEYEW